MMSKGQGNAARLMRHSGMLLWLATAGATGAQQVGPHMPSAVEEMSLQRRPTPGPAANNQGPTLAAPEDFSKVALVPGTLLSMDTAGVPEFSGLSLRIDARGDVFLPGLGTLHVGGLLLPAAQDEITKALVAAELLIAPTVQLNVVQFAPRYVSVLGEVQTPGRFQLIGERTLAEVLALAGGETLAAASEIEIQRGSDGVVVRVHYTPRDPLQALKGTMIQPGDSIYVRRAGVVYVLGAVGKPGGYVMNGGVLNVFEALSLAGGTNLDAASNSMVIVRPHEEVFETIRVPFKKLMNETQGQIALQQNDVLYVPRSGMRVTLLNGSAILGAAVGSSIYAIDR